MAKKPLNNPNLIQYKVMVLSSKGTIGEEFNPQSPFWENMASRQRELKEAIRFSYQNGFKDRLKAMETIESGGMGSFLFSGRKKFSEQKGLSAESINRIIGRSLFQHWKVPSKYHVGLDRFPILQEYKIKMLQHVLQGNPNSFTQLPNLDAQGELLMQLGASLTTYISPVSLKLIYEAARGFALKALPEVETKLKSLKSRQGAMKKAGGGFAEENHANLEILEFNLKELEDFVSDPTKKRLEHTLKECQQKPNIFIDYQKLQNQEGVDAWCESNEHNNVSELIKTLTLYRNCMNIGFVREAINAVMNEIIQSPVLASDPSIQLAKLRNDYERVIQGFKNTGKFQRQTFDQVIQQLDQALIVNPAALKGIQMSNAAIQFHNMSVYRLLSMAFRFILIRSMDSTKAKESTDTEAVIQQTNDYYEEWKSLVGSVKVSKEAQEKLNEEHQKFKAHLDKVLSQLDHFT